MNLDGISSRAILVELVITNQVLYYITGVMTHLSGVAVIIMISTIFISCCAPRLFGILALRWRGNEIFVSGPYILICSG